MADHTPSQTLRRSIDAMARQRARCPGWVWSCLCSDGGDWASASVPKDVYQLRCRRCGIAVQEKEPRWRS